MSESLHKRTIHPADSVNRAFNAQQRQGQNDWDAYLEERPGGPGDTPVDDGYERTLAATSWDDKGLVKLAEMGRSARLRGDRTTLDDVQDELLERIEALSEGKKGAPWSDGELFSLIDRLDAVINEPKSPEQSAPESKKGIPQSNDGLLDLVGRLDTAMNGLRSYKQSTPNQAPVAPVTGEPHVSEAPGHRVPIESDSTTQGLEPSENTPRTSESAQDGGDGPHDDKPKPSPTVPGTPTAPTASTTPPTAQKAEGAPGASEPAPRGNHGLRNAQKQLPPLPKKPRELPAPPSEPARQNELDGNQGGDLVTEAIRLMSDAEALLKNPNIPQADKEKLLGTVRSIVSQLLGNNETNGTPLPNNLGGEQANKEGGDNGSGNSPSSLRKRFDSITKSRQAKQGEGPAKQSEEQDEPSKEQEDERQNVMSRLEEYMSTDEEARSAVEECHKARQEFLEIVAKSQKGHWRRIKPGGWTDILLRRIPLFGNKLAEYLTKPSKKEERAGAAYEAALTKVDSLRHNFLGYEVDKGNMTRDELRAHRAAFINAEDAGNFMTIAEMQKATGKKPLNKWLRRSLYAASAVVGGFAALAGGLPAGLAGLAIAGTGAGAARVWANKRNANLKNDKAGNANEPEYVVDKVAADYHSTFEEMMASKRYMKEESGDTTWEPGAGDVVKSVYDAVAKEIGKNRNRVMFSMLGPVALTAFAAAMKYGIEGLQGGEPPVEKVIDEPPIKIGGGEAAKHYFTSLNTNSAPELIVGDQLNAMGYILDSDPTEFLKNAAKAVGGEDQVFVTSNGSPLDMYLGKSGDLRMQDWDTNVQVRFSDEVIEALRGGKISGVMYSRPL